MIEFTKYGHGPKKLIGLHGWFGDETTFRPLEQSLDPADYECVWLAHRGYSLSGHVTGDFTVEEMARDALAVADGLGWPSFAVIGHSMGGKAAQILAAIAPDRVNKLVAVAAAPANPVPFPPPVRALFDAVASDRAARYGVISNSVGERLSPFWINRFVDATIARSSQDATSAYLRSWADDDVVALVQGCAVDTLVLAGEHDAAVGPEVAEFVFRGRFPNLVIRTVTNAGHYPIDEAPLAVGAAVADFLR